MAASMALRSNLIQWGPGQHFDQGYEFDAQEQIARDGRWRDRSAVGISDLVALLEVEERGLERAA